MNCVRVVIAGRVQGVAYRAWTQRTAVELGLTGWVRNRRDGKVEALFCGAQSAVAAMVQRCHAGPRLAGVDAVDVIATEADPGCTGFEVRATA